MNKISSPSGFTLIEVMIAMMILTVGLLGVAGVVTAVINGNKLSEGITMATTLAQDKLEEMKDTNYDSLGSNSDTQQSIYTRTWTTTADSPAAGMKTIQVTVQFFLRGTSHNVTLTTIVAK